MRTLDSPNAVLSRPEGLADITLEVRDGRTRLTHSLARPPLVVQRVLYLDDAIPDMAFCYLANPTAGIFEGDQLQIIVRARPGARAYLTTPAATKVYTMPNGEARQQVQLHLEDEAYVEYLPDPIILYRNARFRQTTHVTVAPRATLVYGDILSPGRIASGENTAYDEYSNRLTVSTTDGQTLYHEAFSIAPKLKSPHGPGLLGRDDAAALGTLLVVTDSVDPASLRDGVRDALIMKSGARTGVSVLPGGGGVAVKVIASEVAAVRSALRVAWAEARQCILAVDLPPTRKY